MNINGPTPVEYQQRLQDPAATLRLNQRLSAEVLQVAGERVTLAVDGVRIVARLTNPEQSAILTERRIAQFIVRELAGQMVGLQIVRPGTGDVPGTAPAHAPIDVVPSLLQFAGLEANPQNIAAARALIAQGLPVTPDLIAELKAALDALPQAAGRSSWGQSEANTAAALKAAGQPLSPGVLDLSLQEQTTLVNALGGLRQQLQSLMRGKLTPHQAELLEKSLAWMDSLVVDWSAPAPALAEKLRQAVSGLGRSLEHELSQLASQEGSLDSVQGEGLLALVQLRRELGKMSSPLAGEIDHFLDGLRLRQFSNADPAFPPLKEPWVKLDLPLVIPQNNQQPQEMHDAHLQVAFRLDGEARRVDPKNTRLVITVEMEAGQLLKVDLSVVERQVGAWITTSNAELQQKAEDELPELESGLQKLGFDLRTVHCDVDLPSEASQDHPTNISNIMVNVGV